MTSPKPDNQPLVDATGQPLPRKLSILERIQSAATQTKAIVISVVGALAIIGGIITNIDKIEKFVAPIFRNPIATETQSYSPVLIDTIEVTKVRSIIDR